MASSSGLVISDYENLVDSLREIARKDAQLVDDKTKLLDALTRLTERNEQLLQDQRTLKEKYEVSQETQSALVAALEKQNGLLRQMVEEKEDEVTELEHRITAMESRTNERAIPATDINRPRFVVRVTNAAGRGRIVSREDRARAARDMMTGAERKRIDTSLANAAANGDREEVEALIDRGALVEAHVTGRVFGRAQTLSALMVAALKGHTHTVHVLIARGANVEARSEDGFTALHLACCNGMSCTVRLLIANGANMDATDCDNETPLFCAARQNRASIVSTLVSLGADLHVPSYIDGTALEFAEERGFKNVESVLLSAGALISYEL